MATDKDKHLKALEDIKKLLIMDLLSKGAKTTEIASVLGVNQSTVSRLVPSRKAKNGRPA